MRILDSHEFVELYRGDKDLRMGKIISERFHCDYVLAFPNSSSPADRVLMKDHIPDIGKLGLLPTSFTIRPMWARTVRFIPGNETLGGFFVFAPTYMKVIRDVKPDVILENVYSTLTPRMYITSMASALRGIPRVYVDVGDIPPKGRLKRILSRFERIALSNATKVITYNEMGKKRFMEEYRFDETKINVIPKPVDTHAFMPSLDRRVARNVIGVGNEFVVGYFGRLDYNKGSDVLMRVAARFKDEPGIENTKFIFVGGSLSPRDADRLLDLRRELGLDNVILTGHIAHSEMPYYYATVDVVVFPDVSNLPGFSTVMAESMASGKAIVAGLKGCEGATPIRNLENGIIVEPRSEEQITAALRLLLHNDDTRLALGQAARQYAVEHMDWERVAADYYRILVEAVREGGGRKESEERQVTWLGGSSDVVTNLPPLSRLGFRMRVVAESDLLDWYSDSWRKMGVTPEAVRVSSARFPMGFVLKNMRGFVELCTLSERSSTIIVTPQLAPGSMLHALLSSKRNCVLSVLSPPVSGKASELVLYKLLGVFGKSFFRNVVALTPETAAFLRDYFHFGQINVVFPLVDHSYFKPFDKDNARKKLRIPKEDFVISYHGVIRRERKLENLLKLFSIVLESVPNARLLIVGYGDDEKHFDQQLAEQRWSSRVTRMGRVPYADLPEILSAADVGVLDLPNNPSFSIPYKVLENLSLGIPVVVSNVQQHRQISYDCSAVLVGKNMDELCRKIVELSDSTETRRKIGEKGREFIRSQYDRALRDWTNLLKGD